MEDAILEWRSLYHYSLHMRLIYFLEAASTTPQVFLFSCEARIPATLL